MIESISIANAASYGTVPVVLSDLKKINFFFGSNGSGKTTIGRLIGDEANFPACAVHWKDTAKMQAMVYNNDFVERNFNQSEEFKGVFTLGEKNLENDEKLRKANASHELLKGKIAGLKNALNGEGGGGGKTGDLRSLEDWLKEKCWEKKQKYDESMGVAFEGYRGSLEKFKNKILHELANNKESLLTLAEIQSKAESIFSTNPTLVEAVLDIDSSRLIEHESSPILRKRVIGKNDVDIAAMIERLQSSDWVREGMRFYSENDSVCPFCQQSTTASFSKSLSEYFDETFLIDSRAIDDLASDYASEARRSQGQITSIITSASKFIDIENLKEGKELLDAKISINIQRLSEKRKEPSRVIELESLAKVLSDMKSQIATANVSIARHNKLVAEIANERELLTNQVWRFVLEELSADLIAYREGNENLKRAIDRIGGEILSAEEEVRSLTVEIRELEKQATSVQPTIDSINSILRSFGFWGFTLAKTSSGTSYKLVRSDGSDARQTLSEGEKTFVTFLYFYSLLKGSETDSGITTDRIVVFDDPVSSLDSDVLFVVGSLIKEVFSEVRNQKGHVKQVFVLTHNIYFHKEVTYNTKRRGSSLGEETFWIIRKPNNASNIEKQTTNPIKTSYELLWAELRSKKVSNHTVQNVLRRILENYFKILGEIDFEKICEKFEGNQRIICKSLCSWAHDGSHYAHDDLHISIDDSMVSAYLKVFEAIFYKLEHGAHYRMMMRIMDEHEHVEGASA